MHARCILERNPRDAVTGCGGRENIGSSKRFLNTQIHNDQKQVQVNLRVFLAELLLHFSSERLRVEKKLSSSDSS